MITDDEVMRILERADPARVDDAIPTIDAAGYLDALRTRSTTTVTLIDTETIPTGPTNNHRWWLITAAAAVVVAVVAGGLVLAAGGDDTETQSTSAPSTVASTTAAAPPAVTAAEDVARGFLTAEKVAFDPERASSYLTAEALAEVAGTPEEYRLRLSFLEATGAKTINIDCQHHDDTAAGILIRCTYDDHMFRSDQLGLGPYTGSYQDLTVRDGKIVEVSGYSPLEPFSSQIWNPFKQWVTAEHPDDVPIMYEGSGWRITEESIPLWAQHLEEYVRAQPRVGFIGLPPEGVTPSAPESGEVVLDIQSCTTPSGEASEISGWSGELTVFADGRLIWMQYADLPEGANPLSTGLLEQRLTPEGVDLMRAELIASGVLLAGEQDCQDAGTYHGHLYDGRERPETTFTSPANEHLARVTDPASWLPARAWEDREIRAYVPSKYQVTLTGDMPRIEVDDIAAQLPAAAQELVHTKTWDYQQAGMFWHDAEFTTDEARALAVALDDARLEQDEQANAYQLEYHFEYQDQSQDRVVHIQFRPLLPSWVE